MKLDIKADSFSLLGDLDTIAMLDALPDGAYITDRDRRIVFWNEAAVRITGWKAEDVLNRNCSDNVLCHVDKDGNSLCGDERCPLHRSIVTGAGSTEAVLVYALTKEGARIPVEVCVAPIRNRGGQVIGGIETFRDVKESVHNQIQAKKVQDLALRLELPRDPRVSVEVRYQPRDIIGGDFYRVERFGENGYALLVADVVGHGVSAALGTMLLRSLWDVNRGALPNPKRFVRAVNQSAHQLSRGSSFFGTAIFMFYEATTGKIRLIRAGHPAPLLIRAGGQAESIGEISPAIGMFAEASFVESAGQLEPGDILLLFTDGATDIKDAERHDLGREGLQRLVAEQLNGAPPGKLNLTRLEKQLLVYSNRIRLADDLTLLKLTRRN